MYTTVLLTYLGFFFKWNLHGETNMRGRLIIEQVLYICFEFRGHCCLCKGSGMHGCRLPFTPLLSVRRNRQRYPALMGRRCHPSAFVRRWTCWCSELYWSAVSWCWHRVDLSDSGLPGVYLCVLRKRVWDCFRWQCLSSQFPKFPIWSLDKNILYGRNTDMLVRSHAAHTHFWDI